MRIFARLFDTYTIRAKILVALAFMAFANVAFADSGSLHKFFKKNNVSKGMQEYIKEQCDEKNFKEFFKDLSKIEQIYKLEATQIDCLVQTLGDGSTQSILLALNYGYDEYDRFLNKYYKLYHAKVKKKSKTTQTGAFSHEPNLGQDTLLEEQRVWLKLRDSYEAYIQKHHAHIYDINGGGTIHSIAASSARLKFLKMRVNELFMRYLRMTTNRSIEFDSMLR